MPSRLSGPQELPSVLVVGPKPFSMNSGFGITISNLFSGWPSDRLACLHWSAEEGDAVCARYLSLRADRHSSPEAGAGRAAYGHGMRAALRSVKRSAIGALGVGSAISRARDGRWLDWVRGLDLDLVYAAPQSIADVHLARALAQAAGTPCLIHVMDDWVGFMKSSRSASERFWGRVADRVLGDALRSAGVALGIGDAMSTALSERYGVRALSFQNCPDERLFAALPIEGRAFCRPFELLFTGTVYNSCSAEGLRAFARLVDRLNRVDRDGWVLRILEPYNIGAVARSLAEEFRGVYTGVTPLSHEGLATLYQRAHGLVLAYDDTPGSRPARLSMATKLPSYMLSGTPILLSAPADFACTTYLRGADAALWLDPSMDLGKSSAVLRAYFGDERLRLATCARARHLAQSHLSARVVRPRFREVLGAVAAGDLPPHA